MSEAARFRRRRLSPVQIGLIVVLVSLAGTLASLTVRSFLHIDSTADAFTRASYVLTSLANVQREALLLDHEALDLSYRPGQDPQPLELRRAFLANQLDVLAGRAGEDPELAAELEQIQDTLDDFDSQLAAFLSAGAGSEDGETPLSQTLARLEVLVKDAYDSHESQYFEAMSDALDAQRSSQRLSLITGGLVVAAAAALVISVSRSVSSDFRRAYFLLEDELGQRKRAEAELRRVNEELEADRAAIEELNRTLEKKVRERTEALRLTNEELRERNRQLLGARAQAATDALTGLGNHRAFHERIRNDVSSAQTKGNGIGLIIMDIDGFKRVNDSGGHQMGDHILREMASTLTAVVKGENAYRYGGDEFAVLLPGVDGRKSARIAERVRGAVAERLDGGGRVTVSLGVASFPDMAQSAEELIYAADAAMYWAKSSGKNQVREWAKLIQGRAGAAQPWYVTDGGVKAPDVVTALVAALAAKDPDTSAHTERCSWYALQLAEELDLPEDDKPVVRLAALLHDVGKISVPDEVLFKPGPLDDGEWEQMKQHPTAALRVLSQIRSLADAAPAILHHHEHFDGSGYPDGLTGEEIPMPSRILLVSDAFDAMTTDRPYRKAMSVEAAIEELKRCRGSQFDPEVVDAFLRLLARDGAHAEHSIAVWQTGASAGGQPQD